ncbi:MAG: hypothetical protein RMK65_01095 [Anaerolineae bacterium]|nr:hypothetical protein [Anaerolineae bacterium]
MAMEIVAPPMPPAVRRALGDEAVAEFIPWLNDHVRQILHREGVPRDEYREILSRLDWLERNYAQMRTEFREGLSALRTEFREDQNAFRTEFREDLSALRQEMYEQLGQIHRRLDAIIDRFEARFVEMERYIEANRAYRRWTTGGRKRLQEMDDRWEKRLQEMDDRWEKRFQETNARWEKRFQETDAHWDERLDRMYQQMIVQTRWLIGALLGIGTVISVLLAIAQFTP